MCVCLCVHVCSPFVLALSKKRKAAALCRKERSLHDGPVDDGLDVVLSVSRVDDSLAFGVLVDVVLGQLKAHIRCH